jgi:hypothetical protein
MSTTAIPRPGSRPQNTGPTLATKLNVLTHHWSLDRRLAEGERPDGDPALELRASQLTSEKARRRLAGSLRRTVELAPEPMRPGSTAPLDRWAVLADRDRLIEIANRLDSSQPVGVRGVAMISDLLSDGASPLYAPGGIKGRHGHELANRLQSVGNAL